jgi:hypothetical protein
MSCPDSGDVLSPRVEPEVKSECLEAWYEQQELAIMPTSFSYLSCL